MHDGNPLLREKIVPICGLLGLLQRRDFPHKLGICDRLFGRRLAKRGVCWIRTAAGIPWKLDLRSPLHRWIVYGKYEGGAFLDWAKAFLPADGIVVDSGANIGQMLLYLAKWVPNGRVLAFEPGAEAADWLQECLRVNNQLPVEVIRCALGAQATEMTLQSFGGAEVHGSLSQIRTDGAGPRVSVRRLDEVLEERRVDHVDLWKLDVEGFELQALAGAEGLLRGGRIRAIYAEMAFGNEERIRDYLRQQGYRCYLFDRAGRLFEPTSLPRHTNGLFLPA
jgi:FkbM family methyltransferase